MNSLLVFIVLIGFASCALALPSPVTDKAPRFSVDEAAASRQLSGLEAAVPIRERRSPVTDRAPRFSVDVLEAAASRLDFDGQLGGLEAVVPIRERRSPSGTEKPPRRQKRATCDLLSGFGVNDSACALHCIALGRRGGWCDSRRVCNCR